MAHPERRCGMSTHDHDLYDRDDGLAHCKVCNGAEGSLPTLCPERRMTPEEQQAVYDSKLDFNRGPMNQGQWWRIDEPIDMVLHCPACGLKHIDAPQAHEVSEGETYPENLWTNPPHRSHQCQGCNHIWRPADVPTNGVEAAKTKGKADSAIVEPRRVGGAA